MHSYTYWRHNQKKDYDLQWFQYTNTNITFNLQNIVDYTNTDWLETDEYILKYFPHSNTYEWHRNFWSEQPSTGSSIGQSIVPLGSFATKTTTKQISSRRTLSTAVPIDKIAQATTYSVFNGETEFNSDIFLEKVNDDIGVKFSIYNNTNK